MNENTTTTKPVTMGDFRFKKPNTAPDKQPMSQPVTPAMPLVAGQPAPIGAAKTRD